MTPKELLRKIQRAKAEGWKELDLCCQGLTELPDAIGELTALEALDLSGNRLTELPAAIGQLTGLRSLDLGWGERRGWPWRRAAANNLKQLPAEIGQLTNLSWLDLGDNNLKQLPTEIGQLTNLSSLDLSDNQLSQLPPEIGQLTNLSELSLSHNQLSQLPAEIGQLTNLSRLSLRKNPLSQLPAEIGLLTNLTHLHLESLPLKDLPPEIQQLTKLERLDLRDTSLPIPPELLGNRWDKLGQPTDILKFYFGGGARRALNEAKLLVVGQGSVGKTSLVNRLLHNRFNPQENKTEGIQIQPWQVETRSQPGVWQALQQTVLKLRQWRSQPRWQRQLPPAGEIQLNVWDFGGQEIMHATHQFFLTQRSLYLLVLDTRLGEDENRLEYWLNIIKSFGGDSPIIVIGNKSDQQALDLDRRGLQGKYPRIKTFVETSCKTGQGIDTLKAAIQRETEQLAHVKDELPLSWFDLKRALETMERDYLPYAEYQQLCQEQGIDDEPNQQLLLGFLHDLGVVLNFRDDPRLEDTNILNPVWVTNGVYQILNDNALMTQHKGILQRAILDRILDRGRYPHHKQLFIIDMMRKFELCFDRVPDEQFLIPDLLPKEEPDTGDWSGSLAFQYHYNVLPGSIISRFIVRASQLISKQTYWRSGAVLAYEDSRALVKADREDKKIFIWVGGAQANRRELLGIIRSHFDPIHSTLTGLEVAEKVPLPERPEVVVNYRDLRRLEAMGEETWRVPELLTEVNIQQLLDGLEPQQLRWQQEQEAKDGRNWEGRIPRPSASGTHRLNTESRLIDAPEPGHPEQNVYIYGSVGSVGNQGEIKASAGSVQGDQSGVQHNEAAEKQDLAAAAQEIQQLLEQLSQIYPTTTLPDQMKVATQAVEQIESQPKLKARIVSALKAAGTEAFQEAIDHPAVNVLFAAIEGWKEAEGSP